MIQRLCKQIDLQGPNRRNMKKTAVVVTITVFTMIAEIGYGLITGSMALLADGVHMGTHAFALMVTLIAYRVTARNAGNPDFAFSSGKVGILGGYTNAIILGITAFYMMYEAVHRLIAPEEILFNQALWVAVIGLGVNVASALLLASGDRTGDNGPEHDHNLRSAYLHVITDAMTSVFAILALLTGKFFDQTWPDAVVAVLGAGVILKWAYGLAVSSGRLLVDHYPMRQDQQIIKAAARRMESKIDDLHIWRISENEKAAVIHVAAGPSFRRDEFDRTLRTDCGLSHLTVDVG